MKKMTVGDYVTTGLLGTGVVFGFLGGVVGKRLSGKLVSIGLAVTCLVVGAVYFFVFRSPKHDYKTSYGTMVLQGKINRCEKADVERWSAWVVDFWTAHGYPVAKANESLRGKLAVCVDAEELLVGTAKRSVRGLNDGDVIYITYSKTNPLMAEYLFEHEASHWVLTEMGTSFDETTQHAIFKEKRLGR